MAHIFIALENPRSMLGYNKKVEKIDNYPTNFTKPRFSFEPEQDKSRGARERKAKQREQKYAARQAFLKEKGQDPFSIDETRAKDREIALAFCKANLSARMAQAGSLVTLMKTMIWYKEQENSIFHTAVFLGHGNTDIMAVGTGPARFEDEEAREIFNVNKREITVANPDIWSLYFAEAANRGCFMADTDGRLHIFLLGCLTGAEEGEGSVLDILASKLNSVLKIPIAAYGPTVSIDSNDTQNILDKLAEIKRDGPKAGNWAIGDGSEDDDKYLRVKCAGRPVAVKAS